MTRKGGGIEDSRGSKGFVLDRTKGANCGCIIPWTLRKISKRNRKKREDREGERREGTKTIRSKKISMELDRGEKNK